MGGKKMRNLSYKKVDERNSGVLCLILCLNYCGGKKRCGEKNVLYALLLWMLITLLLFLGREKTEKSWAEYSICTGDWQSPALDPRVSGCYRQTVDSLHCRQGGCSTGPSGSTGEFCTAWAHVFTSFLNQPRSVWLSLSLALKRICNMISMKVQANFV